MHLDCIQQLDLFLLYVVVLLLSGSVGDVFKHCSVTFLLLDVVAESLSLSVMQDVSRIHDFDSGVLGFVRTIVSYC